MRRHHRPSGRLLAHLLPWLLAFASCAAMAQADPPARAGSLSEIKGSVVLAAAGETDWRNAVVNRPVTPGDRLWTDQGARAEVHLGTAVLHLDDETFLETVGLDRARFKATLHEGTVDARVREIGRDDVFEFDTPNLAFRALQPGDYRIGVDPGRGTTLVSVRTGSAIVYGADGRGQQLLAGQQLAFGGRLLEQAPGFPTRGRDVFDRWAAERNWRDDQSIAANFVPREVVGYSQLDAGGAWVQDATHGAVWYPELSVPDWAPYRYGRWEWVKPWGWTWIDDAPWGFAPFHYGRWAMIGSRWAWVPGRLGARPVYAPALVAFVGSRTGREPPAAGPGVAWYPLAPGESWQPAFPASANYLKQVNRSMSARNGAHVYQRRPEAVTALQVEQFARGGAVPLQRNQANAGDVARAPSGTLPSRAPGPMLIPPATATGPRGPVEDGDGGWKQARPPVAATRGEAEDPHAQWDRDRAQREQQIEQQRLQRGQPLDQWQRLR